MVFVKVWLKSRAIAHFSQPDALILKIWKNSLSPFRGRWGQDVIYKFAEAKFWISSSFNKFSFRIFVVLDFEVVWPRQPQRPQKRPMEIFWKWPQINANFPKIYGRYKFLGEVAFKPNVLRSEEWCINKEAWTLGPQNLCSCDRCYEGHYNYVYYLSLNKRYWTVGKFLCYIQALL